MACRKKEMRTQRNSKPTALDIHLKYLCAGCGSEHWISIKENQTKGFKIVCYMCDIVIEPKVLKKIDMIYEGEKPAEVVSEPAEPSEPSKKEPLNTIQRCAVNLVSYGFDEDEAKLLAEKAYEKYKIDDVVDLVKKIIFDFGAITDEQPATSEV